ncbi:MAG TPA: NAD(P)-dependent oxidoreductase [Acidimicrobiia bacterium]|nr:NAD(P)-dependent oxidoreductase [Acidimicrobiia bacterium]
MSELGFIGLGIMGSGMANNLVGAGYKVTAWNRTPGRSELVPDAVAARDLREVGRAADVVFVCVSDTPDVEEVCFGSNGVVENMGGGVLVDHSTISPIATEEFAERAAEYGVTWIDAPVSGGSEGARDGTLAVMAGGDPRAMARVTPFIETYASSVVHVGDRPGSGQMAKMVNQALVVINQLAASEALLLAHAAGLDLEATIAAVGGGAGGSWMFSNRGPQMIRRDWSPGFTIDLQQKDLRLVLDTADNLGVPLPGTALVFQMYRALQKRGLGDEGNHALVKALEEMAGMRLGQERASIREGRL